MHFCQDEAVALITAAGLAPLFGLFFGRILRAARRVVHHLARAARRATRIFSLTIHACSRLLPGAGRSGKKAPEEHHV
jgi:hypothetical protein